MKFGHITPTKKWSISKKVARAHVNTINFDWSKLTNNELEPNTIESNYVAKWVQQFTRSGRAYKSQEKRAKEPNKAPVQPEESRVVE